MLALTITCEIPAAREPTTPASTSGPVTLGSKATAPNDDAGLCIQLASDRTLDAAVAHFAHQPERSVGAETVGGLGDIEQRADESQSRRDGISHAQLELLSLYRRQHLVTIDRRRRRNAGLLETRHPAAKHSCAVRETDDGRDVVERALAGALGLYTGDGQHVLVVARTVNGETELDAIAPREPITRGRGDLLDRVLAASS